MEIGLQSCFYCQINLLLVEKKQPSQSETRIYCQYFRSFDVEI